MSQKCPLIFKSSALQAKILVIVVSLSAHFSFLHFEIAAKSLVKVVVKEVAAEKNDNITLKIFFFLFSSKTYVVGSQKNRLIETVLLSTQNIDFN